MAKYISLTKGQWAVVDDEDYEWLMQWKWAAHWDSHKKNYYADRCEWIGGQGRKKLAIKMHRLILGLDRGDKRQGDHINGNSLDNRRSNLRIVTNAQNSINRRRYLSSTTGCKGVSFRKDRGQYQSRITMDGKTRFLGFFSRLEDAAAAYRQAAKEMHGEFSRHISCEEI